MTARAASIEAYHSPSFQSSACAVRDVIAAHVMHRGPMTRREIASDLHMETSSVSGRVCELIEARVLVELDDQKPCPITKRNVRWVTHAINVCQQRGLPL